jgi:hypothetical protein
MKEINASVFRVEDNATDQLKDKKCIAVIYFLPDFLLHTKFMSNNFFKLSAEL